jgi:homoserine dehydrogenase
MSIYWNITTNQIGSQQVVLTTMLRIVIVGFGTVGKTFSQILHQQRSLLLQRYGLRPRIVGIIDRGGAVLDSQGLDIRRTSTIKAQFGSVSYDKHFGHPQLSALDVIDRLDADVMIEVSPTNLKDGEPALSHIRGALKHQLHVITANKGPLALAFPAMMELAVYNNVSLQFSGTVGAGTPLLALGKNGLHGDQISSMKGILNGTTNYILTQMTESGTPFTDGLREAQRMGYAESDPTNDVDGFDTAAKLVILANWVMNRHISLPDVHIEGIRQVTPNAIAEAKSKQQVIKLLASITENEATVQPHRLQQTHPLNVSGTLNAVTYTTKFAGEITLVGHGAGGRETASAILRDLIDIRQNVIQ